MGLTLNDPFTDVVRLRSYIVAMRCVWMIVWGTNEVIDIGKWSIYGGGLLESFHTMHIYIYACVCVLRALFQNAITAIKQMNSQCHCHFYILFIGTEFFTYMSYVYNSFQTIYLVYIYKNSIYT